MRLIDADALKKYMDDCGWCDNCPDKKRLCEMDCRFPDFCTHEWQRVIDEQPTIPASPWHRVEEKPKEGTWCVIAKHSYLQPHNLFYDIAHYLHGTFSVYDSGVGDWFDGKPLYWMPIEPPKEDA